MASWSAMEQEYDDLSRALHEGDFETMARIDPAARAEASVRRRETVAETARRLRPDLSEEMREVWIESRR